MFRRAELAGTGMRMIGNSRERSADCSLFVVHPLGCARYGVPTGLKSTLKAGQQTHRPEPHAKVAKVAKENFNAEARRNAEVRREDISIWIRLNRGQEPHAKVAKAAKEKPKPGFSHYSAQFLCGL